jgi:hypothetical protein
MTCFFCYIVDNFQLLKEGLIPMPAPAPYKPSPIWRKNRLVAKILMRKQSGKKMRDRDILLARHFQNDPEILERLLDQAMHSLKAPIARE